MLQLAQRNHVSHTAFFPEQANLTVATWGFISDILLNSISADLQVCQTVIKCQFIFYLQLFSLQCLQLSFYSNYSNYPSIWNYIKYYVMSSRGAHCIEINQKEVD